MQFIDDFGEKIDKTARDIYGAPSTMQKMIILLLTFICRENKMWSRSFCYSSPTLFLLYVLLSEYRTISLVFVFPFTFDRVKLMIQP